MAEGTSEDNSSWESWLGGWVQSAKEKSSSALEFVKRDLAEFSTVIQEETEKAIEKTSSSLTRENTEQATTKVKAGISSFLGNISKALVIPPSDDYVPVTISADGTTLYDRGKARLHAIQLDASTYVDPPKGSQEQFEMWLNSFDMDTQKGEISEILVSKVEVRALYTKLVPNEVSHAEFWHRYFYRVHQLQCDEARKQALMQRVERTHGDSLSWDEDDWSGGEDDEGNQSDWEKMPRPQQQPSSSDHSSKIDQSSKKEEIPPKSPANDSCLSTEQASTNELASSGVSINKNITTSTGHSSVSPPVSNTTTCDKASASYSSSKSDSGLETVHDHFAPENSPSFEAEARQDRTETPADTKVNLQVSVDTACASTPEAQAPSEENIQDQEPGSSAEVSGRDDPNDEPRSQQDSHDHNPSASSAAAASGFESSICFDETSNNITGDAACGAADVLSTPSSSIQQGNVPSDVVSDASPASTDKQDLPEENHTTPVLETNQDKTNLCGKTVVPAQVPSEPTGSSDTAQGKVEVNPDIAMRVKGDMVLVGEIDTPSSNSSDAKGLDDDWEEDFDVEVTEEDLKAAEDIAKRLGENLDTEDDWENWD